MANRPKVLLFGVGSVGAVYLYLLSKTCEVTAVCRSTYDVVKEKGFVINSSIFGQNLHVTPNVVRSCNEAASEISSSFDYILVCCKAMPGVYSEILRPAVSSNTVIVLMQNGIGIEDEYAAAFPHNSIVSVAVYCKTTQRPAGIIAHDEVERLEIGSYPSSAPNQAAENFTNLIKKAGGTANFHEDVQKPRWYKLLANASWNPICALTRCTDVGFMISSPTATALILDVMLEVADIAKAYGYEISKEEVEAQLERAKSRIGGGSGKQIEPSMLQDVVEGRKMEVEAIVGNAVRLGREKGVEVAKLELIYALVTALDSQMGRKTT